MAGDSTSRPLAFDEHAKRQNIVLFGGGGGASAVAPSFARSLPDGDIVVITGVADSGGATGRLRRLFDIPAVGDLRNVASALSTNQAGPLGQRRFCRGDGIEDLAVAMRRFESALAPYDNGYDIGRTLHRAVYDLGREVLGRDPEGLQGQPLGNLVLTQMIRQGMDVAEAIDDYAHRVAIPGNVRIMPSSIDSHTLFMRQGSTVYQGEHEIDVLEVTDPDDVRLWVELTEGGGPVRAYSGAERAIRDADLNVLMPASLWTSIGASTCIPGISQAFMDNRSTGGTLVATANILKAQDTIGLDLPRYMNIIAGLVGREADVALVNDAIEDLPDGVVPFKYEPGQDLGRSTEILAARLLDVSYTASQDPNDAVLRSSVRTDGAALISVLASRSLVRV